MGNVPIYFTVFISFVVIMYAYMYSYYDVIKFVSATVKFKKESISVGISISITPNRH